MRKEPKGEGKRDPYWSREAFVDDLKQVKSIKGVCEIYANRGAVPTGWQGYYASVQFWRKKDANFDKQVRDILADSEVSMTPGPGRPRKDGGDRSWQEKFCEELYKVDGNRDKASKVTPYSLGQITDMLDERTVSFDKDFFSKVAEVEAKISAEIEEMLLSLRKEENFGTFEQSKITQTKGWYALKVLEKLDKMRYGKYVEMSMKANITHEHNINLIPREERLFNLWEEQKKHLEKRQEVKQLMLADKGDEYSIAEPERKVEEVVDGEVIND